MGLGCSSGISFLSVASAAVLAPAPAPPAPSASSPSAEGATTTSSVTVAPACAAAADPTIGVVCTASAFSAFELLLLVSLSSEEKRVLMYRSTLGRLRD